VPKLKIGSESDAPAPFILKCGRYPHSTLQPSRMRAPIPCSLPLPTPAPDYLFRPSLPKGKCQLTSGQHRFLTPDTPANH